MKNKYAFVALMLVVILVVSVGFTNIYVSQNQADEGEDFVVVTSFYPMYIAAMNVIGDTEGVTLKNLSEPQTGCLHDFQLTPADMKLLSTADVFIINGGGIESFMEEIAVQYPNLTIIEACDSIELLCADEAHEHEDVESEADSAVHEDEETHSHDDEGDIHEHNHDVNAHAWMSVALYRQQIETIATGLARVDKQHEADYLANASTYDTKLAKLQKEQEDISSLAMSSPIILLHSAYEYVAMDYDLKVAYCMDLDEERQVSAGEVAEIIDTIQHDHVKYIFAEKLYGESMCEMVKEEIDVTVIYLDPLTRGEYEADSYIEGMKNNLKMIYQALNEE